MTMLKSCCFRVVLSAGKLGKALSPTTTTLEYFFRVAVLFVFDLQSTVYLQHKIIFVRVEHNDKKTKI